MTRTSKFRTVFTGLVAVSLLASASGQTVWIPDGTSGIADNTTNGFVGIKAGSPGAPLQVGNTGVADGIIRLSGSANTAGAIRTALEFFNPDGSSNGPQITSRIADLIVYGDGSGGTLAFYTSPGVGGDEGEDPTERMRITDLGNVGIGSGNPTAKLEVNQVNPSGWGGNLTALRIKSPDTSYYLDLSTYIVAGGNVGYKFNPNGNVGLVVTTPGKVGIGTTNPSHLLTVNGTIKAEEVIVEAGIAANDITVRPKAWADDVFSSGYQLQSLAAVAQHIASNGHLPGVPNESQVAANGVSVAEMQSTLLRKVEELTLHLIEQNRINAAQAERIEALESRLDAAESGKP